MRRFPTGEDYKIEIEGFPVRVDEFGSRAPSLRKKTEFKPWMRRVRDKKTGKTYDTLVECSKDVGISHSNLFDLVSGRRKQSSWGVDRFEWYYDDSYLA